MVRATWLLLAALTLAPGPASGGEPGGLGPEIRDAPTDAFVCRERARSFSARGQSRVAIAYLLRAVQLAPADWDLHFLLALEADKARLHTLTFEHTRMALRLYPACRSRFPAPGEKPGAAGGIDEEAPPALTEEQATHYAAEIDAYLPSEIPAEADLEQSQTP